MTGYSLGSMAPVALETASLVEAVRRSVVQVRTPRGQGSGVVWSRDGLVVTNNHVVSGTRAEVEMADGRWLPAAVVARDAGNDLAALRVPARGLASAPVRDPRGLRVGELIVAVGSPFGVPGTATLGILSARSLITDRGRELLQADVDLSPGNSGGPLTDCEGRVVGIASMVLSPGIALAIPSHIVDRFVAMTTGRGGSIHGDYDSPEP